MTNVAGRQAFRCPCWKDRPVAITGKMWLLVGGLVLIVVGSLLIGLDRADKVASIVGAGLTLIGLVLGGIGTPSTARKIRASRTGKVRNRTGGPALTGIDLPASAPVDEVVADQTGDIEGGSGEGTTGIRMR
jgi:hypothetical protein